ncbi:MAG: dCMP deaminase family protein [Candidatus Diapherotrites archaeon]|nr:dCMP deaminase family protein [Candidatus Diapherotrites archaeon]
MNSRPSKDQYYLDIAKAVAERSPCIRRKFGAIIVRNDAIVSTGYNGPPRGGVNCFEIGCLKDEMDIPSWRGYDFCPAVHAEENSVVNAARHGTSVIGGVLYIYGIDSKTGKPTISHPCDRCKRVLINAGIKQVITMDENGNIVKYDVADWIKEDTDKYVHKLQEVREKKEQKDFKEV